METRRQTPADPTLPPTVTLQPPSAPVAAAAPCADYDDELDRLLTEDFCFSPCPPETHCPPPSPPGSPRLTMLLPQYDIRFNNPAAVSNNFVTRI